MGIKGVIFDVGQTLSNQLDKGRLEERNKIYYTYVFQELLARGFSKYFPNLSQYTTEQFVNELNTLNMWTRKQKNISTEVLTEYRMSEQTIDVLVAHEKTFNIDLEKSALAPALSELDEIYSGTSALDGGVYELWPDTKDTLVELRNRGIILGLASNTAHPVKHEHMLARLGITPLIDHFAVSSYIGVRKPNPEMCRILLEKMGLTADEVIVVGDLLDRDILMGNLAGTRTVWINAIPYSLEQNLKRITEGDLKYRPYAGIVCLAQLIPTIHYLENVIPDAEQVSVGYYFPHLRKKLETGKQGAFVSNSRVKYMPVELRAPIENLGEFDVIVHKITDLLLSDKEEDKQAIENLERYLASHPKTLLLDPIQGLRYTNNRRAFLELFTEKSFAGVKVRTPCLLNENSGVFPCIVKTEIACQINGSHDMVIVKSQESLIQVLTNYTVPVIIQSWINHQTMVKVYILGETYQISSQKVLVADQETVSFNSAKLPDTLEISQNFSINTETIIEFNQFLRDITGLGMISYDLAIEETTGDYVIVDLNYFPGYYTMPDYKTVMDDYIVSSFRNFKKTI